MDRDTYLRQVENAAIEGVIARATASDRRKFVERENGRRDAMRSFPNHKGGYAGYRGGADKPPVPALSPRERFHNLVAFIVSKRRNYRFLQTA